MSLFTLFYSYKYPGTVLLTVLKKPQKKKIMSFSILGSATYDPFQFHQKRCTDCDDDYSEYWELQSRVNLSGVLPVLKYKSRRTGLTVVLAQADSPIVNGYFCLATEDWTNEGLPHTLEHLIFLGRYVIIQ